MATAKRKAKPTRVRRIAHRNSPADAASVAETAYRDAYKSLQSLQGRIDTAIRSYGSSPSLVDLAQMRRVRKAMEMIERAKMILYDEAGALALERKQR